MTAYYNEIDATAAHVLRHLIAELGRFADNPVLAAEALKCLRSMDCL